MHAVGNIRQGVYYCRMPQLEQQDQPGTGIPAEPAVDRRVRRSRRALHAALVTLSAERGYDSLTVDDLTTQADMARRTFYAHYVDKDALLGAVVDELLADLDARLLEVTPADLRQAQGAVIREMFAHGQSHRDVYRMVLSGAGNGTGLRTLANALSDRVEAAIRRQVATLGLQPRLPIDFIARTFVGQHLTLLRWWLDNQALYTLEEMTAMRFAVLVHGETWAQGFGGDGPPFMVETTASAEG
jgi:AcrR family transcriptional regulator